MSFYPEGSAVEESGDPMPEGACASRTGVLGIAVRGWWRSGWELHKALAHAHVGTGRDGGEELEATGCEDENGGAMFEPTEFFASLDPDVARHLFWTCPLGVEEDIEAVKSNGCYEDGGDGDQGNGLPAWQFQADCCALIAAEETFDSLEGDGIDVPSVAAGVGDMSDASFGGCVKAMIHRRRQSKGDEATVAVGSRIGLVAEEVLQGVGESFGLEDLVSLHRATSSDDSVARADKDGRSGIDGARSRTQFAGEAIAKAFESGFPGIGEVEVGECFPDGDGESGQPGASEAGKPTHPLGGEATGNAVGEEEVEVFLQEESVA